MNLEYIRQSSAMLIRVAQGATYAEVAWQCGLTRSCIEQRVKALARDLQVIVGVVGVEEGATPTARLLRERQQEYLEALEHYSPSSIYDGSRKNAPATEDQIELLIQKIQEHSKSKTRDVALLLVLFSTAAKPLEIARLEVRDFLLPDGTVREESTLRTEAAANGKPRPLFFCSPKANAAICAYLDERQRHAHGVAHSDHYRGFDPLSRLFLTRKGEAMEIIEKRTANRRQYLCVAILDAYRKIFGYAGIRGISAMSARRTVAQKLSTRGSDSEEIGRLLGLKGGVSVRRLLGGTQVRPSLRVNVTGLV